MVTEGGPALSPDGVVCTGDVTLAGGVVLAGGVALAGGEEGALAAGGEAGVLSAGGEEGVLAAGGDEGALAAGGAPAGGLCAESGRLAATEAAPIVASAMANVPLRDLTPMAVLHAVS